MAEQRLTRKGIRAPDQFLSTSVQFFYWIRGHTKYLIYSVLGLLLCIGLTMLWSAWHKQREQQAATLFYEALKPLGSSERAGDPMDRTRMKEQLEQLVRDYDNTSVSGLAHWHLGQLAFGMGDYAHALTTYQYAQQKLSHTSNAPIYMTVTLGIGYVQEASGLCEQAIHNFDKVLQSSAHWLRGEAYLGLGRCYEKTGGKDQILTLADHVLSDKQLGEFSRQNIAEQLAFLRRQVSERAK